MKLLLTIMLFFNSGLLFSQSLERSLGSSAGNLSSGANLKISATIGEPVVSTQPTSNLILTQGFQQTNLMGVGIENMDPSAIINIYPNPNDGKFIIDFKEANKQDVTIIIYDFIGRKVFQSIENNVQAFTKEVDIASLAEGSYMLFIRNKDHVLTSVKLIKVK